MPVFGQYLIVGKSEEQSDRLHGRDNCACVEDGRVVAVRPEVSVFPSPAWCYRPVTHHTVPLEDGLTLLLPHAGDSGPTVVNAATLALLQRFADPADLAAGTRHAGEGAGEAADCLAALGLLQPVEAQPRLQSADILTVWLHVTNECNLACHYCFVAKSAEKMSAETGQKAIEAVFRSAVYYGMRGVHLKYAGGEATMNFGRVVDLHTRAADLAARHGLALSGTVLSNGIGWSDKRIALLQQHDLALTLSIDGIDEDHNSQRPLRNGGGSFAPVARTLDRLLAHGVIPYISVTVSQRNSAGLPRTVAWLLDKGVPFTFNFYRETEQSADFVDLRWQDDQFIAALREALALIARRLADCRFPLTSLLDLTRFEAPHEHTCGVGHSYMVVTHHGTIAKCHMHLEQSVGTVEAANPLHLIRTDQIGIQNPAAQEKVGCRDCEWRPWCAGGCPALTRRVTGRYDVQSPNCRIYKALFPELLRLEGRRMLTHSAELAL